MAVAPDQIDHKMEFANGDGAPLSRSVTVTMSNEAYERMFFQPTPPRHGDFAKRFGNPTLLGLLCFLIPYTSTILTLCQFAGAVPPTTLVGLTGDYYFIGVIGMLLAGIAEFVLGNTYPFAVFVVYGCHWGALGYAQDPFYNLTSAFSQAGGATGAEWNSSQAFHNVTMCLVSFVLFIGTFRVNALFVLVFFGLVMLFAFLAAADFAVPHVTNEAGLAHVLTLIKFAGGFGFLGVVCGWYLAFLTVMEAVGLPKFLPILDLGHLVFPPKQVVNRELQAEKMA